MGCWRVGGHPCSFEIVSGASVFCDSQIVRKQARNTEKGMVWTMLKLMERVKNKHVEVCYMWAVGVLGATHALLK